MKIKFIFLLVMLGLYHYLFWGEYLGLNLGLFHLVWLGVWFRFYPTSLHFGFTRLCLLGTTLAAVFGVLYHSSISYVAYFVSFGIATVYLHAPILKSLTFGIRYALWDYWRGLCYTFSYEGLIAATLKNEQEKGEKYGYPSLMKRIWGTRSCLKALHSSVFPLLFLAVFWALYRVANPDFAQLGADVWLFLGNELSKFFHFITLPYILFLLAGTVWITSSLFHRYDAGMSIREALCSDLLLRFRKDYRGSGIQMPMNELSQEYRTALLTFALLNVLLCLVNLTDVGSLWISFDPNQVGDYKDMVHRSTYLLIFSILLSMFLVLYWFRGNLNFYPQAQSLRRLALVWIFQNAFLSLSVGLRTYYYIAEKGLAYKRIGVLLFLVLTLFGLLSLALKVKGRKSLYFVWKYNSWAAYVMLIAMSTVDWDMLIVRYNLSHFQTQEKLVDGFTLERAPKTLRLIYPYLKNQEYRREGTKQVLDFVYQIRIPEFIEKFEKKSWKSWNYSEYITYIYLKRELREDIAVVKNTQIPADRRINLKHLGCH